MIPKIIHYCWFGGNPLPELAQRCIASWRKYLPDYEIWEWTEDGNSLTPKPSPKGEGSRNQKETENDNDLFDRRMTFDVNIIPYTAEAYKQKKYAFVSDYARFWIMYKYGGIYFDTDVEVIRPMDDIISRGNFMGFELDPDEENSPGKYAPRYCFAVALGLGFGMMKNHPFIKKMMNMYEVMEFVIPTLPWGKTIVAYTTEKLMEEGLLNKKGIQQVDDIIVYPHDFFAPINVISGKLHITKNTYTIHWYMGSWDDKKQKSLKDRVRNLIPEWVFFLNNRIKRRMYRIKQ